MISEPRAYIYWQNSHLWMCWKDSTILYTIENLLKLKSGAHFLGTGAHLQTQTQGYTFKANYLKALIQGQCPGQGQIQGQISAWGWVQGQCSDRGRSSVSVQDRIDPGSLTRVGVDPVSISRTGSLLLTAHVDLRSRNVGQDPVRYIGHGHG